MIIMLFSGSCEKTKQQAAGAVEQHEELVHEYAPPMSGITGLKDTSRIIKSEGKFFCYATAGGIKMIWTTSLETGQWKTGLEVFPVRPQWWSAYSPKNSAWAPDVVWNKEFSEYRMYYCVSTLGSSTSAIGLATNKTLDPQHPQYQWVDKGMVISSQEGVDTYNALDPCPVQQSNGEWFLAFGSHFGGIKLIKLNASGKWHQEDTAIYDLARKNTNFKSAIEAPAIYSGKKEGKSGYWLFVNWGTGNSVANGENATYEVKMGWSTAIQGPYLDKDGIKMNDGGGTVFLKNRQSFDWDESTRIARGHVGIIKEEKLDGSFSDWVSYSYWLKDPPERNGIRMGIQKLTQDEEGWPKAGAILRYDYK